MSGLHALPVQSNTDKFACYHDCTSADLIHNLSIGLIIITRYWKPEIILNPCLLMELNKLVFLGTWPYFEDYSAFKLVLPKQRMVFIPGWSWFWGAHKVIFHCLSFFFGHFINFFFAWTFASLERFTTHTVQITVHGKQDFITSQ